MSEEIDWRQFKARLDNPRLAPCPFCGIRHEPSGWHPFCDMVTRFHGWRAAGKPELAAD
jgi:hypothetical protein